MIKLMYITNNIEVAKIAEKSGVDRIFVDLEYLGKEERQKGLDCVKSKHKEEDVLKLASVLNKSELLVRINPINEDSKREIDTVIDYGADIVMLPMFKTKEEVDTFLSIINRRVKTILLLEHIDAVKNLDSILELEGIDEVHIGLNDLHLSMGLTFMFELLSNGIIEKISTTLKKRNIPFGIGGISRIGTGALPAEIILTEHYRLGSTAAILSRSFCNSDEIVCLDDIMKIFEDGVKNIRMHERILSEAEDTVFIKNYNKMEAIICDIVAEKQKGGNDGKF